MLSFIFTIVFFLFQIGVVLSVIGLLAYDAKVAYGKESFQDIWEELGQGKGVVSFILFFLPTAGFFVFFSAYDVLKPIVTRRTRPRTTTKPIKEEPIPCAEGMGFSFFWKIA